MSSDEHQSPRALYERLLNQLRCAAAIFGEVKEADKRLAATGQALSNVVFF